MLAIKYLNYTIEDETANFYYGKNFFKTLATK